MRRWPALLATLLTATSVVGSASPATAAPPPPLVWERRIPEAYIRESSPLLVDLDVSGSLEIVVGGWDRKVHALQGSTGADVGGWPATTTNRVNSSASAADVTGDGVPEVFIGSGIGSERQGALYSYDYAGRQRFRTIGPDPDFPNGAPVHATPAIADITGDGVLDANVGTLGVRSVWSFRSSDGRSNVGRELFYWDDTIFSSPAIHDIDGDGTPEMIIGGDSTPGPPIDHRGGMVRAIDGAGRSRWEYRTNDIVRSSPAVGDITGDGRPEVVFGAGDYYHESDSNAVFAVDAATGKLLWRRVVNGVTNGAPALADVNGDGRLDVAIGTFDRPHTDLRGGIVYALDGPSGTDLSGFPQPSGGGAILGGLVTADVDGDGGQDLFVPTGAFVAVLSGKTGARLFNLAEGARVAFQNSAAVADLDGNGRLDVVAAGTHIDGTGHVYRWELPAAARAGALGWPQFRKDPWRSGSWTAPPPRAGGLPATRVAGSDRYATAAALSAGATRGGTIYVATGAGFADALAGGPAAAAASAPVLLVGRDHLPEVTRARIRDLLPRRIVVLGGPAAVSDAVFRELATMAEDVRRVAGANRYATAAAISSAAFSPGVPVAYVATGAGFADALAGGAAGARRAGPVLLVEGDAIPPETAVELRRLLPTSIVILGGTGAVSSEVETQLRTYSLTVTRAAGADRYASAVEVSKATFPDGAARAYLATGANFPDALAGGPVAGKAGAPLLLVPGPCVPTSVRAEVARLGVDELVLLGGAGAVSAAAGRLTPC